MNKEIEAIEMNETWDLVGLPTDKTTIDNKWVYKIIVDENSKVEKYKARLVTKGFTK